MMEEEEWGGLDFLVLGEVHGMVDQVPHVPSLFQTKFEVVDYSIRPNRQWVDLGEADDEDESAGVAASGDSLASAVANPLVAQRRTGNVRPGGVMLLQRKGVDAVWKALMVDRMPMADVVVFEVQRVDGRPHDKVYLFACYVPPFCRLGASTACPIGDEEGGCTGTCGKNHQISSVQGLQELMEEYAEKGMVCSMGDFNVDPRFVGSGDEFAPQPGGASFLSTVCGRGWCVGSSSGAGRSGSNR